MQNAAAVEAAADDVTFKPAWCRNDQQMAEDVKRFWSRQNMSEADIADRESGICATGYDGEELVAVSTASLFYYPLMRNNFFIYRCMVAPHIRQQNLAWKISAYSFKLLQDWSRQNAHEKALGLMILIETDKFSVPQRNPAKEKYGITLHFVGYSPAGQQLRVVWFDGAMLDDDAVK